MRDLGVMTVVFLTGAVAGGLIVSRQQANAHAWLLVGVMAAGGLLGGGVNYLLAKADEPADAPSKASVARSLLAGVAAALLVPLFLNMLSSKLLETTKTDPLSVLVFLGFCLVAAVSSKAFITTISDRLISEVKQVKRDAATANQKADSANEKANAAVEGQTEPPPTPPAAAGRGTETPTRAQLDEGEERVLRALTLRPGFKFRYLLGVANDSGVEPDEAGRILASLEAQGLVAATEDKESRKLYYLTSEGKAAVVRAGAG